MTKILGLSFKILLCAVYLSVSLIYEQSAQAFQIPQAKQLLTVTPTYNPVVFKGMTIDPSNSFRLDFLVDSGEKGLANAVVRDETNKLMRYFFAGLTLPEDDL